jgi:serine/threonine protein kinase
MESFIHLLHQDKNSIYLSEKYKIQNEIGRGKSGSVFVLLELNTGKKFVLKEIRNISYFPNFKKISTYINDELNSSFLLNTHDSVCDQIASDNYTNQVLIHMILNKILKKQPNYLYQYDFYCHNNSGFTVCEYANLGDLSDYLYTRESFSENWIIDLFRQVCKPLLILKQDIFGFHHSDLKTKNILVHMNTNNQIIYKIADFDKSSIFYNNVRFFNDCYNYTLGYYKSSPFRLHRENSEYLYYNLADTDLYGRIIGFHEYFMSNPKGFFMSFDYYTFFYSFILEKPILGWMLDHKDSIAWNIYHYLFHFEEEEEWSKFMNNLNDIYSEKIKGNTQSIVFYWNQFKTCGFKLRYDVSKINDWLDI